MDYAVLPPEINSTLIYAGPGSGSLLAAAGSWDSLAAELSTTAETYESVLSGLTSLQWHGAASEAMMAAAAPYVGWLYRTAEQTQQTAMQARAAAASYELAHAMTVPPAAVITNRAQLAVLIATNLIGQNTAAIAATEAQYAEYWAQDATAMYGYATSSAGAARLTQFSSPQQTANESGQTAQNSAVSHAASSAQATNPILDFIRTAIEDLIKDLQEVFSPQNGGETTIALGILDAIAATGTSTGSSGTIEGMVTGVIGAEASLGSLGAVAAAPAAEVAPALSGFTTAAAAGGAGLGNVTASLARAGTIGSMSVPVSWSAQSTSKIAGLETAGMTSLGGTEEAVGSGYPGFPGMPGATASRGMGVPIPPRYGVKLTVMPRPASVG